MDKYCSCYEEHAVFLCSQRERLFEQALKKERGFIIKKMEPDGACLFRAVGVCVCVCGGGKA